jgi:hypothetical protein
MLLEIEDFNNAQTEIAAHCQAAWSELEQLLRGMPIHLKASDQAGKQGKPIFDPIGTNEYIRTNLGQTPGWQSNIPIPEEFSFLGTDVDLGKGALVVEAQFSNYPFLLNNTIRSELFFKAGLAFGGQPTKATVLITKAHLFPASNSTLYFEQAKNQLTALAQNRVFDSPLRIVVLFGQRVGTVPVIWSEYTKSRYSRIVRVRRTRNCTFKIGKKDTSRCVLTLGP